MQAPALQYLLLNNGERLAYRHSPGLEPGVLFCTGFKSDMQGSKALALEAFCRARGQSFTRFDYRGHGESSGAFEDGTIGAWHEDTLAILDAVTQGPQLFVGSSMGGWIMLLTALARPQRVAGLVGIAAAPDFTGRLRAHGLNEQQRAALAGQGYCDIANCYEDGAPYRIRQALLEDGDRHALLDRDIAIAVPVRLLHGLRDEDVPWQTALTIMDRLDSNDVEVQLIKDGDHRLSAPGDLVRLVITVAALLDQCTT